MLVIVIIVFGYYYKYRLPIKYEAEVRLYAEKYQLDPNLVFAIIYTESKFDPEAVSRKGAMGLMQLMPTTAEWAAKKGGISYEGAQQLTQPVKNIEIGCYYLSYLMVRFDNNISNVLAAYNGGEGNVRKWLSNLEYSTDGVNLTKIPFKETEDYVKKVTNTYEIYASIYTEAKR